jgi:2-dehydropantoate 2-reductase
VRYVVIGAGAIGGAVGGRLHQHGHAVILVARGRHYEVLSHDGLRLSGPDGEVVLDVPTVSDPADVDWGEDDVVLLATKTHQTRVVIDRLVAVAPNDAPILCVQNGLANERMALRCFPNVHGVLVLLPATHLEPGSIVLSAGGITGVLDVGRAPAGVDDIDTGVAADLSGASFSSRPQSDVVAWKRAKLLRNVDNAIEATCADLRSDAAQALAAQARAEAEACFVAAGWRWIDDAEFEARQHGLMPPWRPADGASRTGGSTWQSLLRHAGSTEVDYLNGEIVLLGRLHEVPAPANTLLQATVRRMAVEGREPGTVDAQDLLDRLGTLPITSGDRHDWGSSPSTPSTT